MMRREKGLFYPFMQTIVSRRLMKQIMKADDSQINQFISAIVRRYEILHPDWEVVFLSLPKDEKERSIAVGNIIRFLQSSYNQQERP